jgi:hypothetical protein
MNTLHGIGPLGPPPVYIHAPGVVVEHGVVMDRPKRYNWLGPAFAGFLTLVGIAVLVAAVH